MNKSLLVIASCLFAVSTLYGQQDYGVRCDAAHVSSCNQPMARPIPKPLPKFTTPQVSGCTLAQSPAGGVPVGGQTTFTPSPACGSGTFTLNCYGGPCGTISAAGVYSPPANVPSGLTMEGFQIQPLNSIWTMPVFNPSTGVGLPPDPNDAAIMGRIRGEGSLLTWNTNSSGSIVEVVNTLPANSPSFVFEPFEGGWQWQGELFPACTPPYCFSQQGLWMPVVNRINSISFDNHEFDLQQCLAGNPAQYCLYILYKKYPDCENPVVTVGNPTKVVCQSHTTWMLQPDGLPVWIANSACSQLNNTSPGWLAHVVQQPANGTFSFTVPVDTTACRSTSGTVVVGVAEGTSSPTDGAGDNAQSGGIYNAWSNLELGGPNAAQSLMTMADPDVLHDRLLHYLADPAHNGDPNCGGCFTAYPWATTTTADNLIISPDTVPPATGGPCNVTYEHPCYTITNITVSNGVATATVSSNYNNNEQPCSGQPQFSQAPQSCTAGQQLYMKFGLIPASSSWSAMNGVQVLATAIDSGGTQFTFPLSTNYGTYPSGQGNTWHSWNPYGERLRLLTAAEGGFDCTPAALACSTGTSGAGLTCWGAIGDCNSKQTYGLTITDGTLPNSTWNSDLKSTRDQPLWLHNLYSSGSPLQKIVCPNRQTGGAASGFGNCLGTVNMMPSLPNGAYTAQWTSDGTTNYNRQTVTFTGSLGTASQDAYPLGAGVNCQQDRMHIAAMAGNLPTIVCSATNNVNPALTYTILTPVTGAQINATTGKWITIPTGITSIETTEVSVCGSSPTGICKEVWISFLPVASVDLSINLWFGGQSANYAGCSGQQSPNFQWANGGPLFYGPVVSADCAYEWQADCTLFQGDGYYNGLFGSFRSGQCANWSGVANGGFFGMNTMAVNDQVSNIQVPGSVAAPKTYNVTFYAEAGYDTTGTGQAVMYLLGGGSFTTPSTVLASYVDEYTCAGGQYRPCVLGPYQVTVTDGTLYTEMMIGLYNPNQYEGPDWAGIRIVPVSSPGCVITVTPSTLPPGTVGQPYSQQLTAAGSGCTPPLNFLP